MEERKIKDIDYRRFDLINETLNNYYKAMLETADTADYVPPRYCKRINKMLFKEYKYTCSQAKRNYKKVHNYERNQTFKAKMSALKEKIKAELLDLWTKLKAKFKKQAEDNKDEC